MTDPTIEITDFNIIDDSHLMLSTKRTQEDMCDPGNTNIFLASFTTSYARMKLLDHLLPLADRCLYVDTDSLIYTCKEGESDLPLGDMLGELTDELGGGGGGGGGGSGEEERDFITTFICGGPKNYAYRTHMGKEVCKVKGFSLNYGNSKILNFESMKDVVFNINDPFTGFYSTVNESKICRNKLTSELYSQKEFKQYAAVHTKRVVLPNLTTIPFGY